MMTGSKSWAKDLDSKRQILMSIYILDLNQPSLGR